jgi:hypothetical protein
MVYVEIFHKNKAKQFRGYMGLRRMLSPELRKNQQIVLSSKVVTPVKTGVQCFCNPLKSLDSGACPGPRIKSGAGPDPGFTGMTIRGHF